MPWLAEAASGTIADRVAADMAKRIAEGDIEPGDLLTELDVAEQFAVSRTPIREAMLALERWGLIRLAPKKGGVVTHPSVRERTELLAVRSMLEREAFSMLDRAAGAHAALLEDLDAILADQRAAIDEPREFALRDYSFHLRLVGESDNRVVAEITTALGPRLYRLTRLAVDARAAALSELHAEHVALRDAIASGDRATFDALIASHLDAGHTSYELAQ